MKETLNRILEESFKNNWDRPALSDYKGKTLHYRDVARKIVKLHILFESSGIGKGEKVALCSRNQSNWGVVLLACLTYGAIPVPILHEFKAGNIEFIVNHSESKCLFVSGLINDMITPSHMPDLKAIVNMDDLSLILSNDAAVNETIEHINELFGKKFPKSFSVGDVRFVAEQNPDDLAMINYTSGTSGFSKGVMIPYRALLANINFARKYLPELDNTKEVVSMLPSAHMYGMMFEFLYEMCIGCHVHFLTRTPSPSIIVKAFEEIKPAVIISVPLIIEKIYKNKLQPFLQKPGVRFMLSLPIVDKKIKEKINATLSDSFGGNFIQVIVGGAPFNKEAEKFFHDIGFRFTVGYGMTECAPLITYSPWNNRKLGSCGKVIDDVELKIDSSDPTTVPGEILVKGPVVMLGYYKNEEATKDAFTEDGWMRTGDLGILDAEGFLFIKGRCKSMILGASGQNIYPEEIEGALNNMPYVAESLVIEDNGRLVALVYPDMDSARDNGIEYDALQKKMEENIEIINTDLPNYSKIANVKLMPEEFEKTPKRSIKRYIYQNTTI